MSKRKSLRSKLLHPTATQGGEMGRSYPGLFERKGNWTLRIRVPDDVRLAIGKREVWISFGGVPHAKAVKQAHAERAKWIKCFEDARSGILPTVQDEQPKAERAVCPLPDAVINYLGQRYLHQLEAAVQPMPFDQDELREVRELAEEEAALVGQATEEDPSLQRVATRVAAEARVTLNPSQFDLLRVTRAVQRAEIEHHLRQADRAQLLPGGVYDGLFRGIDGVTPPENVLTLEKAAELYLAEHKQSGTSARTEAQRKLRVDVIIELLGRSTPVNAITRATVREMRDVLLKLPPNASKRFPGKPLREIAEIAAKDGLPSLAPKTLRLYIEALSTFFSWLVKEDIAVKNPAIGLGTPALPEQTQRRPFTTDELKSLFAAPGFNGSKGKGWSFWLPRISLYTGARFAEMLGLKAADIRLVDGVGVMNIEPNDIRGLKTRPSRRMVPIHPALVKLGLLDYAKSVPADGLLFPDTEGPKDLINAREKVMARRIRAVIADKNVVFHSFRHTFKDAAKNARLSDSAIASIGGWDLPGGRTAMDGYGRDKMLPWLAEEVAKINYGSLF